MLRLWNINNQMQSIDKALHYLQDNLYSIEPILQDIDRKLLSLAYTPGVGTVCLDIQKNADLADELTFRSRAIAIVSDGSLLNCEGRNFGPVMDWFVYQIKHFTGLDAFPFIVMKSVDLSLLVQDLSTTYGTILYLDSHEIREVPKNILFVSHQKILDIHKC